MDKLLLRRILQVPISTCIESLYLEDGLTPIRGIIKAKRINYLHTLVNLKEDEMLQKFFKCQWQYPVRYDWVLQVQEYLKDLKMDMDLEQIKSK